MVITGRKEREIGLVPNATALPALYSLMAAALSCL